jgi:phosphatidate cytidylyltransferase
MLNIAPDRLKTGLLLMLGFSLVLFLNNNYVYFALFIGLLIGSISETRDLYKIEDLNLLYFIGIVISVISVIYPITPYLVLFVLFSLSSFYAYKGEFDIKIFKAIMYPILPFSFFFVFMYEYGLMYLLWVIAIVVVSDIGAYIVGKNIGKTLFSKTSPNKTLEGVIGALVLSSVAGAFVGVMIIDLFYVSMIISFVISFFSIFGDLFESFLKRQADIKDSGDLLPGHGGILDRLDGFLFAVPVFYIMLECIKL